LTVKHGACVANGSAPQVLVHCWGGGGRTGIAQAAYLMASKGLTAEAAAEAVMSYAQAHRLLRRVDVAALKEFAAVAGIAAQ
jgi:protein-tyrosine phosphatase